ncbi:MULTISPECIES: sensor domain-containing diguanylate cyclase [Vibrio]|uniref:sensor domain-containing diguanylate cyclase n=1 Tax=Vibrio TaxID=662 RepID=UPI00076AAB47|nr:MULTISPECIES: sensor domain-containing diguanylate cyclase [Vibrio]PQJ70214.1 hypothetical protein BTO01_02525 [Vibrio jasicida]
MDYDLEHFFNMSIDLCCVATLEGQFKYVNDAFEKTLGWSKVELVDRDFMQFVHPEDIQATIQEVSKLSLGIPTIAFRNRYICSSGDYKDLLWTSNPERKTGLLYAVAKDITSEKNSSSYSDLNNKQLVSMNKSLQEMAYKDPLTGLFNRRKFLESIFEFIMRGDHTFSLVLVDIDNFKTFNDLYGHLAGDEILTIISSLLNNTKRIDDIIARYGGEEFILLLPRTDELSALGLIRRLQNALYKLKSPYKKVTCSFGATTFTKNSSHLSYGVANHIVKDLIHQADLALYHSKNTGRDKATHFRLIHGSTD